MPRDNRLGLDPKVEPLGKEQQFFWLDLEEGWLDATEAEAHTAALPPPPRVLSPRAEATWRLSKHKAPSERAQEPGGRL